ncbi:MAG: hypothetical protein ACK5T6_01295, partial [Pirellula sp.]
MTAFRIGRRTAVQGPPSLGHYKAKGLLASATTSNDPLPSFHFYKSQTMPKPAISTTPYANQWDWNLLKLVIRRCREKGAKKKVADSTGASLSGTDLLLKSLVLRRIFERDVLDADDKH